MQMQIEMKMKIRMDIEEINMEIKITKIAIKYK